MTTANETTTCANCYHEMHITAANDCGGYFLCEGCYAEAIEEGRRDAEREMMRDYEPQPRMTREGVEIGRGAW